MWTLGTVSVLRGVPHVAAWAVYVMHNNSLTDFTSIGAGVKFPAAMQEDFITTLYVALVALLD